MMKIFPILQIILLAFFVNAGKDSSDHPDPDLNQPTIEEKAKGKDSPDYLDLNQPTVDEEAKGKDSPDHPDLNQTTAKAKRQRISLQDTEVPIPSAVKGNVAGSKGKAKATATGSDREDSGVSGIGKRNRVGVLLRDAMKATQVKGKAPAHGKKTIKTDMTNKTATERDDAGQSKFTSLKNWLSSNLDSIKKIKKENVVNSKNLDTLLTIGDIGGNLLTGQIRNALFGAVGAVKGHVENKEREKERVELINQMVEMNEEFKEYYESLNGAIYRMVSSNSNQGNNSGYFQDVVLPFEMMKTFFEALVSSNKKQEKQTDKKFKQKREMAQNAYARKCKKNPALKALLAIKSYVNDSLWPENYSVNFLDHRNKKKELVRFIGKIIFQTQYLQLYATTCVDIDDKNEIEFDIISQTYSEIKILLNKWLNQALDLAWPRLFTEKVIPDAVNSIIMKLENNEITAKTLNLIAQKIVEESLQYGRKCFKYQAIVVKKDDCTVKDYKCPWIDLPKYSKLDPDNSMDQASIRRSKIKIEKEASSSKDNDANEEGSKNMQNVPICVLLEYSGLQIWLARMFIVDYDESVPTHSTVKYTEKVEELVKKENNDKLMESIQSGLPQKITGRLWITSTNFKTDKCSIGIASELISGAVDYGLEKYEISNQGGKKHFFFFNPKGNEKIITHAKLFAHSNSFTINFLNKDGIVLHHFHDLDDMNHRMRIGQFVHVQNRWEKTNSQDYNYFNVNETFNLELEFDIGPNKIITYLNSVKVYEFKRDLLARIERLVIAGNMQLQNLIQENDNGKHELYKHKDSSSVDMGPLLALTMGPSINEK